ncbi:hypothetical protein [Amycolatopsis sp. NPDC059021]|uniref:hypothetical protein n=1 Tax=Amycolatopsis sp. NPDC059021 TaxID=3346704 RepID=UPI00366ED6BB
MRRARPTALAVAAALIVSAVAGSTAVWWPGPEPAASGPVVEAPTTAALAPAAAPTRLIAVSRPRGERVVDGDGNVLYRYNRDRADPPTATCSGVCTAGWAPVLSTGPPVVSGIDPRRVGLLRRPDGTDQVTLGGWPLYRQRGRAAWFATAPGGG